jgi:hypothetical protein
MAIILTLCPQPFQIPFSGVIFSLLFNEELAMLRTTMPSIALGHASDLAVGLRTREIGALGLEQELGLLLSCHSSPLPSGSSTSSYPAMKISPINVVTEQSTHIKMTVSLSIPDVDRGLKTTQHAININTGSATNTPIARNFPSNVLPLNSDATSILFTYSPSVSSTSYPETPRSSR